MMTLIIAAAAAAAHPAAAPATPQGQMPMTQTGQSGEHKMAMDCCKECCKDMEAKHGGHSEHGDHAGE